MQLPHGAILFSTVATSDSSVETCAVEVVVFMCMCANVVKQAIKEMLFGVLNLISSCKLQIRMMHESCQQRAPEMEEMEPKQGKASAAYVSTVGIHG